MNGEGMVISIKEVSFELNSVEDMALRQELLDNAGIILTSLRGTIPQNREMGLVAGNIIGKNVVSVKASYSIQAIEQLEKYEPRLKVLKIAFEIVSERINPKVVLSYNGN